MRIFESIFSSRVWLHILFWCFLCLFSYATFSAVLYHSFSVYLANLIAVLPAQIFFTYVLLYYLIPSYFMQRKFVAFAILFCLALYLAMIWSRTITIYVVEEITDRGFPKESMLEILSQVSHLLSRYFLPVISAPLIFIPIKILKDRLEEKGKIEELKKEKAEAQLSFLKSQINPHFLFNTLNNLYLLTLEKRDEAPEIVMKLSEILDYLLYQCKGPKVHLVNEVKLLQNYIDLEKLRYGKRLSISFTHSIQNIQAQIAPLILLTFVENAFKHGGSEKNRMVDIKVDLQEKDGGLFFRVVNSKKQDSTLHERKGIGRENYTKQLELLYPDHHTLEILDHGDEYIINLSVDL